MSSATQVDQHLTDPAGAAPAGRGRLLVGAVAASVVAVVATVVILSAIVMWALVLLGNGFRQETLAGVAALTTALVVLPSASMVLAWRATRGFRLERERVVVAGLTGTALAGLTLLPILLLASR